jgi:hypothetical protein
MLTERQVSRAKPTRTIFHARGTPSINYFKAVLKMNAIKNFLITMDDVKLSKRISALTFEPS